MRRLWYLDAFAAASRSAVRRMFCLQVHDNVTPTSHLRRITAVDVNVNDPHLQSKIRG